jgi:uncharacterized protein YdiU (UPF0061 family)
MASVGWNLEATYAELPESFFQEVAPARFQQPRLTIVNDGLAKEMGLSLRDVANEQLAAMLAGQMLPPGARPIAQAYAGHQFGGFTMLGDGRAVLLGEQRTPAGELLDLQLKGAGRTAFSRGGDGRAALGPMLREYLISESMHALGIPTTRSLAVVQTGEPVYRETSLPGAVLVRVASSHIRVGTFQYLAARRDRESLRVLADYTINRHFPALRDQPDRDLKLLRQVIDRQAELIARWQLVGFVHGVMNTDNMAVSGETIDYGPCAFMDTYHSDTVFSSIDDGGRYAFGNQPNIAHWNLVRFAETLVPLLHEDSRQAVEVAMSALDEFPSRFDQSWMTGMRHKLGMVGEADGDRALIDALLAWMQTNQVDYTNTFDDLSTGQALSGEECVLEVYQDGVFQDWYARWRQRIERDGRTYQAAQERMRRENPAIIPRNHRVEEALVAASGANDMSLVQKLLEAMAAPYERDELRAAYRSGPRSDGPRYRTFCGT